MIGIYDKETSPNVLADFVEHLPKETKIVIQSIQTQTWFCQIFKKKAKLNFGKVKIKGLSIKLSLPKDQIIMIIMK